MLSEISHVEKYFVTVGILALKLLLMNSTVSMLIELIERSKSSIALIALID